MTDQPFIDVSLQGIHTRHELEALEDYTRLAADAPPGYVPVVLIPVEVFGEDDCCEHGLQDHTPGVVDQCESRGYGLSDAVSSWSDCNRARGHIYRAEDDGSFRHREPGDFMVVYVPDGQQAWFQRTFGS